MEPKDRGTASERPVIRTEGPKNSGTEGQRVSTIVVSKTAGSESQRICSIVNVFVTVTVSGYW